MGVVQQPSCAPLIRNYNVHTSERVPSLGCLRSVRYTIPSRMLCYIESHASSSGGKGGFFASLGAFFISSESVMYNIRVQMCTTSTWICVYLCMYNKNQAPKSSEILVAFILHNIQSV